jgi:hypothetical protein
VIASIPQFVVTSIPAAAANTPVLAKVALPRANWHYLCTNGWHGVKTLFAQPDVEGEHVHTI